jgi:hypothetical protein
MAVRFSKQMIPNLIQPFWATRQGGEFLTDAAALVGTHRHRGLAWLRSKVFVSGHPTTDPNEGKSNRTVNGSGHRLAPLRRTGIGAMEFPGLMSLQPFWRGRPSKRWIKKA